MKHILSVNQFKKNDLKNILECASIMEKQCKSGKIKKLLENKIVACIFLNLLPEHVYLLKQQH